MPSPAVLLVSMPWASTRRPNLGLSTLCVQVRAAGTDCQVLYPCLDFAAAIGTAAYEALAETPGLFAACEHVFSLLLFTPEQIESEAFLRRYDTAAGDNPFRDIHRRHAAAFVDATVQAIIDRDPAVVGFGCTFNQTMPALAVARRLKARRPDIVILFGGGSIHGPMGVALAEAFADCIDHAFLGEADHTLPRLIACLRDGGDPRLIPGITVQGRPTAPATPIEDLDAIAIPDFDDYFTHLRALGLGPDAVDAIPFESSRGCWWGQKHHCTFCGLNNEGMAYRRKSDARVLREIMTLSYRHRSTALMAADNIMPTPAWKGLLPALADSALDLHLFYEIKANITRDQAGLLARAGIRWVQPGIESFSTRILKLMRKGLTALQNVMLLRLCKEFAIAPAYNILVGFPGETMEDNVAMAALLRRITHLDPPGGLASLVQVHRFSPFHDEPGLLPASEIRPAWSYRHLIPPAVLAPERYAYFFDRPDAEQRYAAHLATVNEVVRTWHAAGRSIAARLGPGYIEVRDSTVGVVPLDPAASAVMLAADRPRGREELARIAAAAEPGIDAWETLAMLQQHDWLVADGPHLVSTVPYATPHDQATLDAWGRRWLPLAEDVRQPVCAA